MHTAYQPQGYSAKHILSDSADSSPSMHEPTLYMPGRKNSACAMIRITATVLQPEQGLNDLTESYDVTQTIRCKADGCDTC